MTTPNRDPYEQPEAERTVFHDLSPQMVMTIRVGGITTVAMVIMAFIFCLVQGAGNTSLYLLAMNLLISTFVGLVNAWWYRKGELEADKYWFIVLLCFVIIFQCITTDIYVFNYPRPLAPVINNVTTPLPG